MDILKTASGKILQSDYLSEILSPERLYLRILNISFADAAVIFSNPKETIQLWYGNTYISGFNHLIGISNEGDAVKVRLSKE